jgi:hypothetical protein
MHFMESRQLTRHAFTLIAAKTSGFQLSELLNYGALLAFMGVNLASILRWQASWPHDAVDSDAPATGRNADLFLSVDQRWFAGPHCRHSVGARRHSAMAHPSSVHDAS